MSVITFSKDKRAISIMIGYILLITGTVVMSAIVYQYLKSYVPKETIDCPDGVSLFIVDSNCSEQTDGNYELRLKIRNNGRFDVGGYYIKATTAEDQDLATLDLAEKIIYGGQVSNNAVVFITSSSNGVSNFLNPNDPPISGVFSNISQKIYSLELIPVRYQVLDNKKQLVSCGDSRIVEDIDCDYVPEEEISEECVPTCLGDCGDDGCGGSCGTCESGFKCEVDTCVEDLCGNGIFEPSAGEQCDDGNTVSGDGCSSSCQKESDYECVGNPGSISVCTS